MSINSEISPDEIMVVCMARQIIDNEVVVQGIATPLVAAAYLLARKTHAPNLYFASAIGQGICKNPAPLSITNIEKLWLDRAITNVGFVRTAADILPSLRPKEFFRPGQIDAHGNFNNIAFGKNFQKPKLRLPGTGGIPDVTTFIDDILLYIPRHSRVTFVPELDYISGLGHRPIRSYGQGPQYLITDLGQFDFVNGILRLISFHPGVSISKIKKKTNFNFEISSSVTQTIPPTPEELHILREEIDPFGIRRLESLSGSSRRKLLKHILTLESGQG
jgi:acyl CoA:acetate/3-ketoacid CoA transferase beta subunit